MDMDKRSVDIPGHERHELTWVMHGSVVVEAAGVRWRLTTQHALWIPAGIGHRITLDGESLVFPLWFDPSVYAAIWQEPRVITRTPLLVDFARRMLQRGLSEQEELETATAGAYGLLPALAESRETLPMPEDPRARVVAEGLLAEPACGLTLEDWARRVHTSSKTLQRSFVNETKMTFPAWRSTARLMAALPLLERGDQVAFVSSVVGYASTSGFITAFRKRYGYTPSRHQRTSSASPTSVPSSRRSPRR